VCWPACCWRTSEARSASERLSVESGRAKSERRVWACEERASVELNTHLDPEDSSTRRKIRDRRSQIVTSAAFPYGYGYACDVVVEEVVPFEGWANIAIPNRFSGRGAFNGNSGLVSSWTTARRSQGTNLETGYRNGQRGEASQFNLGRWLCAFEAKGKNVPGKTLIRRPSRPTSLLDLEARILRLVFIPIRRPVGRAAYFFS